MSSDDPFVAWEKALQSDRAKSFESSKSEFKHAASIFFDQGSASRTSVGRALFEYSTLMDAFASVQEARILKALEKYEESLAEYSKATEILRATIHFGFLSGYISASASLEAALELAPSDDAFQGFKNAIALFEQSKLTLSFRDEKHPLINLIDASIKYSISNAFFVESELLLANGSEEESRKKRSRSDALRQEYEDMMSRIGMVPNLIDYFPINDWIRAKSGAFVTSFPESNGIWLGNIGVNPALIEAFGNDRLDKQIGPDESVFCPFKETTRGRIRVRYLDVKKGKNYDEGCGSLI